MAKAPFTFSIDMDEKKYNETYAKLNPDHPKPMPTGTDKTSDADITWSFDKDKKALNVTVTACHSMKARLATEGMVKDHIVELLKV